MLGLGLLAIGALRMRATLAAPERLTALQAVRRRPVGPDCQRLDVLGSDASAFSEFRDARRCSVCPQ